ncbi:ATP-dependent Clp protease proteolytic subunit, chloroplastic [Sesamum angolense]|uniref:ATP-dependent Clp protease proteolytic subunit, chloroplastic n=1 Tax=Sesamum angolense TaxID=2727404 RepID=A0AAE1W997_9LAMI|nr:ATP-dependent Clp protease proteolytic subunit, chloroplastic [Sesamum angolense]
MKLSTNSRSIYPRSLSIDPGPKSGPEKCSLEHRLWVLLSDNLHRAEKEMNKDKSKISFFTQLLIVFSLARTRAHKLTELQWTHSPSPHPSPTTAPSPRHAAATCVTTHSLFLPSELPTPNLLKCSSFTSFHSHHQTLNSPHSPESLLLHLSASSPQTPATAMRGAEADAMGLLLKERIVFLGNSIDDFVADAIISQLLLLDALDSTKDIRLFINSAGGSLRCLNKFVLIESAILLLSFLVDEIAIQQMILL